jgi:hypothetical protein
MTSQSSEPGYLLPDRSLSRISRDAQRAEIRAEEPEQFEAQSAEIRADVLEQFMRRFDQFMHVNHPTAQGNGECRHDSDLLGMLESCVKRHADETKHILLEQHTLLSSELQRLNDSVQELGTQMTKSQIELTRVIRLQSESRDTPPSFAFPEDGLPEHGRRLALSHVMLQEKKENSANLDFLACNEEAKSLIKSKENALLRGALLRRHQHGPSKFRQWLDNNVESPRSKRRTPERWLYQVMHSNRASMTCSVVTVLNAFVVALEADVTMRCAVAASPCSPSRAWQRVDDGFDVFFTLELAARIAADRSHFFAAAEWRWNLLDVFLVMSCVFSLFSRAWDQHSTNYAFIRLLRVFRVMRVARIIRVARFLVDMRKMMFGIMSCMGSLVWSFAFLALIMFMYSVLFMQAAATYVKDRGYDPAAQAEVEGWYGTFYDTMFTLLSALLGADWIEMMLPLQKVSEIYRIAFGSYMFLVVVGVLNILTAVFMGHAQDFQDRDLVVQDEMDRMDSFVSEMLDLFAEFDPDHTGTLPQDLFARCMDSERVQAYFQAHQLDTSHADVLFRILDENGSGSISIQEFVLGVLRLKGVSRELDTRVLLYDCREIKQSLDCIGSVLLQLQRQGPTNFQS